MPLTDSMEKPPAPERTAGPIAVFFNSYARLPEHFFARRSPTPVAKPRLIKFNESLAAELGVDTRGLRAGRLGGRICRQRQPVGRRADRDGLCRGSIRQFRSSARGRPRNPAWRGRGPQRRAAGCPIEGRGPNAVLPARRWARCIGACARPSRLVADAGYGSAEIIGWLVDERGIRAARETDGQVRAHGRRPFAQRLRL